MRALSRFMQPGGHYVYATPAYGYAQIALAYAAKATLFVAKRARLHPRTQRALANGANVVEVEFGRLSVTQARAREFCSINNARLLPWGLDFPEFIQALAGIAREALPEPPATIWCVAGSGVLARSLAVAFPNARLRVVRIGAEPKLPPRAESFVAPEAYEDHARIVPPFPSCSNYDAKAWQFIKQHGQPGDVFWNVAA